MYTCIYINVYIGENAIAVSGPQENPSRIMHTIYIYILYIYININVYI
jgi:hypothetical protein